MAENHMKTNRWDRGPYASAFVDLCDTVLSMNERGERAETIVAEIVGPGTAARSKFDVLATRITLQWKLRTLG